MDVSGFYKLGTEERLKKIKEIAGLSDEEAAVLKNTGALKIEIADRMVENVIGAVHLPLGIATNFRINGKEYAIPMAIEEPSVIAAACKAAKLALPEGFTAGADESIMIGQMQIVHPAKDAIKKLEANKKNIEAAATEALAEHARYGVCLKDIKFRKLKTHRGTMVLAEFDVNVGDAMGPNMIHTMLELIAPQVAGYANGEVRLRIITNLAVKRKAWAEAEWTNEALGGEEAAEKILDGYELAASDRYRCATHNKGIMNGIDAVAMATGQDWRGVEAGAHSYAAFRGKGYEPLTKYEKTDKGIRGRIELPLAVATVGGTIGSSPTARICLKILNVKGAQELAMVCACVGLANNFAALYALSTEGIQKGHMKLHARSVAVRAGAQTPEEIDAAASEMAEKKNYSADFAKSIIERIRNKKQ
jgi:hydroxymethylglutaryl-CoA reductase